MPGIMQKSEENKLEFPLNYFFFFFNVCPIAEVNSCIDPVPTEVSGSLSIDLNET